ncbi:MAG: hypothetical protein H6839_07050 [Planctomycetes bacterium]|nr:hypothetical protein [Planctomycetota bacterium]
MQPPPGYSNQPQGQPGPQPGQPYPQQQPPAYGAPGQPQYGMQQQAYYPPRKKGLPGWAWGLIIGGLVLFCGLPVLALAAIPLITSNTRDARRAEGKQLLFSARDAARIEYSRTGVNPGTFSSFSNPGDFAGMYYSVDDPIKATGISTRSGGTSSAEITCTPRSISDGRGRVEFEWTSGGGTVVWD